MPQDNSYETPAQLRYSHMEALRRELRRDLREYADSLTRAQEVRVDALKEDTAGLQNSVTSWSGWWRGIMITVIVALLGLGGMLAGWWNDQSETKRDVADLKTKIGEVDQTVKSTKADFDSFRVTFDAKVRKDTADRQKQIQAVTEAFTKVVKTEMKKSRRR